MINDILVVTYILTLFLIAFSGIIMIYWSLYSLFNSNRPNAINKISKLRPILFKTVIVLILINSLTVLINKFLH